VKKVGKEDWTGVVCEIIGVKKEFMAYSCTLKMEATGSSKSLVPMYEATLREIQLGRVISKSAALRSPNLTDK
jgi:hypothetical protein